MPRSAVLPILALTLAAAAPVAAQVEVYAGPGARARTFAYAGSSRSVIGISTAPSGGLRDTLGLLVSAITPGGPAEKAGIEEGNRLQSIDGVSLRASKEDAEDWGAYGFLQRRLTRELGKHKVGDEVSVVVYAAGKARTVRLRIADADSLNDGRWRALAEVGERLRTTTTEMRARADSMRKIAEERATIGVSVGTTGSLRDTLGVLVMRVTEGGPADKAGIEEGTRIQTVDGIDLRVSRADVEDDFESGANARRLTRALSKKKAGDEVELRVYSGGQARVVRVKTVRAGDLRGRGGATYFFGDDLGPAIAPLVMPAPRAIPAPAAPRAPRMRIDAHMEDLEAALDGVHVEIDGADLGRELARLGPVLADRLEALGPELRWQVDRATRHIGPAIDASLSAAGVGLDAALEGVGRAIEGIDVRVDVDADARAAAREAARAARRASAASRERRVTHF